MISDYQIVFSEEFDVKCPSLTPNPKVKKKETKQFGIFVVFHVYNVACLSDQIFLHKMGSETLRHKLTDKKINNFLQ